MYEITIKAESAAELREKLRDLLGESIGYNQEAVDEVVTGLEKKVKTKKEAAEITEDEPSEVLTLVQIRKRFAQLQEDGRREEVLALLKKYGVKKIQDVSEDDWEAFIEEVQAL
jgi:hypothetical protein